MYRVLQSLQDRNTMVSTLLGELDKKKKTNLPFLQRLS